MGRRKEEIEEGRKGKRLTDRRREVVRRKRREEKKWSPQNAIFMVLTSKALPGTLGASILSSSNLLPTQLTHSTEFCAQFCVPPISSF